MSRPNQSKQTFEERETFKEQMQIFRSFWGVAVANLQEPFTDNKLDPLYEAERKEINDLFIMGVKEGLVGGVCTFAALRMGPRLWNRFRSAPPTTAKKSFSSSSMTSYKFDSTTKATTSATSKTTSFALSSLKLGLDLLISTSVASYLSVAYISPDKFLNTLSEIPLVSGRSVLSERLCGDFVNLYSSIPKQTWAKHHGVSSELDALALFCENCIRRQTYEKQLREEQQQEKEHFEDTSFNSFGDDSFSGGESNATSKFMAIPSPGVPKDLPIDIPWSDRSDNVTNGKDFDDFWDPSFVSQEEDMEEEENNTVQFDSFESDEEKQKGRRRR